MALDVHPSHALHARCTAHHACAPSIRLRRDPGSGIELILGDRLSIYWPGNGGYGDDGIAIVVQRILFWEWLGVQALTPKTPTSARSQG